MEFGYGYGIITDMYTGWKSWNKEFGYEYGICTWTHNVDTNSIEFGHVYGYGCVRLLKTLTD